MKLGAVELLKFKKLKRRLKLVHWQAVGLLEALWLFVQRDAPLGDIGRHSNEDIASAIEWDTDPDALIETLVETGWLDRCEFQRLVVHDWADHAPQWLIGNLNRWGKSFAVAGVLPSDAKQITRQSTKQVAVQVTKQVAVQATTTDPPLASSLTIPCHTIPSPTTNAVRPAAEAAESSRTSDPVVATWGGVAEGLKEIGIKRTGDAVESAKTNGFNAPQVLALIAWLREQPAGAYGPGVLVERLTVAEAAGWNAHEGWPPPNGVVVASEPDRYAKASKTAQQIADDEREARERRESFEALQRLNAPFEDELDRLDDYALTEMVATHGTRLLASQLAAKGRDSPGLRQSLLTLVRKQKRELVVA